MKKYYILLTLLLFTCLLFSCRKRAIISEAQPDRKVTNWMQQFTDRYVTIVNELTGKELYLERHFDNTFYYCITDDNNLEIIDESGNIKSRYDLSIYISFGESDAISESEPGKIKNIGAIRETADNRLIIFESSIPARLLSFEIEDRNNNCAILKLVNEYTFSRDKILRPVGFYDDNSLFLVPLDLDNPDNNEVFYRLDVDTMEITEKASQNQYNPLKYGEYFNARYYLDNLIGKNHIIKKSMGFYDVLFFDINTGSLNFVLDRPGLHSTLMDFNFQPPRTMKGSCDFMQNNQIYDDKMLVLYINYGDEIHLTDVFSSSVVAEREGIYRACYTIDIWDIERKKMIKEIKIPFRLSFIRSEETDIIEMAEKDDMPVISYLSEKQIVLYHPSKKKYTFGKLRIPLHEIDDADFVNPINKSVYRIETVN